MVKKVGETPDPQDPPSGGEGGEGDQNAEDFANEWQGMRTALQDTMKALTEHLSMHHGTGETTHDSSNAATIQSQTTPGTGANSATTGTGDSSATAGTGTEQPPAPTHWWHRKLGS